jgi:transposase
VNSRKTYRTLSILAAAGADALFPICWTVEHARWFSRNIQRVAELGRGDDVQCLLLEGIQPAPMPGWYEVRFRTPEGIRIVYTDEKASYILAGTVFEMRSDRDLTEERLRVLNAILYVAEHGCKWRGLPKRFGNWHTIYTRMNRWSKSGVLDRLFEELQHAQIVRIKIEAVSLDSTVVKVHPDGTGALKKTAHKPSANRAEDGLPRFIWLPRMLEPR